MRDKAVRFGGREIDGRFLFEFSGGALALDFVNTRDKRPRGGLERLVNYGRLLEWAEQAELADSRKVAAVSKIVRTIPAEADQALADALILREAVFAALKARVRGEAPTEADVAIVNHWLRRAGSAHSLRIQGRRLLWTDYVHLDRADFMLPAIAMSSAGILADDDLASRLRLCASAECDWAFLDRTKRQNRIWCDMSVCGNRAKARRHYERTSRPPLHTG